MIKKKLISKTYLRDVDKYKIYLHYDVPDCYVSVKKIEEIKEPFIISGGLHAIDNGYYIVEVLPKSENYTMRVFFNEKKERVAYYFDITLNNGIDEENLIPYYNDLFLDVTIEHGILKVLDEDELADALNTNVITKKDYDLANTTKDKLVESIKSNNNKYMKMDLESYLI